MNWTLRTLRPASRHSAIKLLICAIVSLVGSSGCQELVHMGQISDREGAWAVKGVLIEQQQKNGSWKKIGNTDGNGRWWVVKDMMGNGAIRLSKPGYYSVKMTEAEFLQQTNVLMSPSDGEAEPEPRSSDVFE